ncbi:hypothetical protein KIM372_06790 [Bombiscardovia nodaiensis]|uniref:Energy-coupling factor transporter transmembrane protein EcfT n=1 Tax=Bombiscardovia nodaiensis TaxID=2932181 RepID=A0ABN6SCD6_9BIFI|nr:hypothetical protein KIM372_06790 [Bombiscardovia nodaiensis]
MLDEVTASLDPQASARIMALLQRLHQRGVTIVMNTHADREALSLADQTLLLERGKVLAYGPASSVVETYHQLLASESDPAGQLADQVPRPQTSKAAAHPAPQQTTDSQSTTSQVSVQTQNQPQNQNQTPAQNPAQDPAQTPAQASARQPAKSPAQDTTQPPSKHTSLLARLDPRAKMVTFLLAMFTAFTISTPRQLLLALVVTAGLFVAARAPLRSMFKSVKGFLVLMFLLAVLNLFVTRSGSTLASWGPLVLTTGGIWVAVLYSCRFMLIIFLGALLVETTTPTQMTDAFESLLRPLGKLGVHTNEIALVLSLALRFIPTLGQEVKAIVEAQAARGGSIESGSLSQRLHAALAVTVPVFAGALRHADNLSQALDARCYEGSGQRRTHYRLLQFKGLDFAFVSLMVIYLLALVLINFI